MSELWENAIRLRRAHCGRLDLRGANLMYVYLTGAHRADTYLERACLAGACLAGANLERACLAGANLVGACLADAYLAGANLAGACLAGAHLERACLAGANLVGACLTGAHLERANLMYAYLAGANLAGAHLERAHLERAYPADANLTGAHLAGTCLDPAAPIPPIADEEILAAGLELDGDDVHGWRTRLSQHVGEQEYVPGQAYEAPVFSVAPTGCHPGLYLAGEAWLRREYPEAPLVRVRTRRVDLHHGDNKWRCRRLTVLA